MEPGNLCIICQHIFDHWKQLPEDYNTLIPFYTNVDDIQLKADAGCCLCSQLNSLIEGRLDPHLKIEKVELKKHDLFDRLESGSGTPHNRMLRFELEVPGDEQLIVPLHIAVFPEETLESAAGTRKVDSPVDIQADSRSALPLVAAWVQSCSNHSSCGRDQHSCDNLPTRLIFTGHKTPVLCNSSNLPHDTKYATLSHCWGKLQTMTLTRSNLLQFQDAIPEEALTTTFSDTIEVTQFLGVQYLWIDSLCIIQDDANDWAHESAKMSSVYGSSYLNIAATGANDGGGGLFMNRKDTRRSFRAWATASIQTHEYVSFHCVPLHDYSNSIVDAPLLQRGWVIQERLLSPRTVHFTSTQVFWECNAVIASEAFRKSLHPGFLTLRTSAVLGWRKSPIEDYHWHDVVSLYSSCQLTFGKDKLSAIAGIAKRMQSIHNGRYLAGVWYDNDLVFYLCWRSDGSRLRSRPPYRAPSWSWASTDSCIDFPSGISKLRPMDAVSIQVKVISAHITSSAEEGLYGAITSGSLQILCNDLVVLPRPTTCYRRSHHIYQQAWMDHWGYAAEYLDSFDSLDDQDHDTILPMLTDRTSPDRWHFVPLIACLVLKLTGSKPGQYKRVGYAIFRFIIPRAQMNKPIPLFDSMEAGQAPQLKEIPSKHYVELRQQEDRRNNYLIEII